MSRSKYLQRVIHLTCAAAGLSVALPVMSADVPGGITEVVVTAQKREESLTEIPIAISAFTSEKRDQIGVDSVADMANFTPGFIYNQSQDRVTVRGIGRYTNQLGADSSVGVYEDGAFETFTVKAGNSSLYTDRIEVLRGPQGTLYGRNSIGGAVNIISRRPTKDWYAEVRLSEDNYNNHVEEGAVSGPITDNLQFRLVATKYDQTKGYFNNIGGGRSSGNVRDEWVYEGQLAAQLGESDEIWVKVFGGQWNNGGGNAGGKTNAAVVVGPDGKTPTATGVYPANLIPTNTLQFTLRTDSLVPSLGVGYLGVPGTVRTGPNTTGVNPANNNIRDFYSDTDQWVKLRDYYGVILQYNHHFSGADLKYIGAAQHYNYFEGVDWGEGYILASGLHSYQFPGSAVQYPNSILLYGEKHTWNTNELNLISTESGPLQYVAGVYNYNEVYMQPEEIALPGQAQLAQPLVMLGPNGLPTAATPNPNPHRDVLDWAGNGGAKTLAGYGQIDWNFTDTWKTTVGLRYSKDWKWGDDIARYFLFVPSPPVAGAPPGYAIDITQLSSTVPYGSAYPGATAPVYNPTTGYASRRLEGEWSGVTGTAGFQWNPDDMTNFYVKYSRGYKSGGFNSGYGIAPSPRTDPEHSNDYQIGFKKNLGSTVQLNIDTFYDQYYSAQIPIGVSTSSGVISTQFFNIPEARSSGVEIETIWQPIRALQFLLNYGYNDTSIKQSGCVVDAAGDPDATRVGAQPDGCPLITNADGSKSRGQDLTGNRLPNAPKNKIAANGNYTIDVPGGSITFSATYIWRSNQFGSIFNRPYTEAPSWSQTDARIQWKTMSDHLTVIAYGKNIFDQIGYSLGALSAAQNDATGAPAGFIKNYQLTPPRIFGGELQYKF